MGSGLGVNGLSVWEEGFGVYGLWVLGSGFGGFRTVQGLECAVWGFRVFIALGFGVEGLRGDSRHRFGASSGAESFSQDFSGFVGVSRGASALYEGFSIRIKSLCLNTP